MNPELLAHYKESRAKGNDARHALLAAHLQLHDGKKSYCSQWAWQVGAHNVTRQPARRDEAWIENTESAGLRFVDYADQITNVGHEGWFTSEDNWTGEVLRGAVWQLSARKGIPRFIGGYVDPNNEGAAYVDLEIFEGEKGGEDNYEAKRDAAMRGDSIAERNAEIEREYNEAWQAGNRWQELAYQIRTIRRETLALLVEARPKRLNQSEDETPRFCAMFRRVINEALIHIAELRKEREELFENYGRDDGFAEFLPR